MAAVATNSLDLLTDEELLRLATALPQAPPRGEKPEQQVRRFLAWEGIRPGRTAGIELHLLYYLYETWLHSHAVEPRLGLSRPDSVPPHAFGRMLSRIGFTRNKAWRRGDSRLCLSMNHEAALRLKKWAQGLELPEYRRLCRPGRNAGRNDP